MKDDKPRPLDRDQAKHDPERVFERPLDIVTEKLLTRGEKLATLNRWRQSVLEELSAGNEGMQTQGVSSSRIRLLAEIEEARVALG